MNKNIKKLSISILLILSILLTNTVYGEEIDLVRYKSNDNYFIVEIYLGKDAVIRKNISFSGEETTYIAEDYECYELARGYKKENSIPPSNNSSYLLELKYNKIKDCPQIDEPGKEDEEKDKDKDKDIEENDAFDNGVENNDVEGGKTNIVDKDGNKKEYNINIVKDRYYRYIKGYEDKTIRPENYINREEVSTIIYRLIDDKDIDNLNIEYIKYNDVKKERWSSKYINILSNLKVLNGYEDGSFKPDGKMTRAELAVSLNRLLNIESKDSVSFIDTKGHWAEEAINKLASVGYIKGYPENKFMPDDKITRAELITIVNRVLNKNESDYNESEYIEFKDLDKDKWYFKQVQMACIKNNEEDKK